MIAPNWHPTRPQLRQFAATALVASGVVGAALRWRFSFDVGAIGVWSAGAVVFALGMIAPALVRPLYRLLLGLALPIGWIVSHVFLRVIFYGILTPAGLVLRAFGRDTLRIKKPNASTYYLEREQRKGLSDYYRQA